MYTTRCNPSPETSRITFLPGLFAFLIVLLPAGQARAAECFWSAGAGSFNQLWSVPSNWIDCEGEAPAVPDTTLIGNAAYGAEIGPGEAETSGNLFLRDQGQLMINGQLDVTGAGVIADVETSGEIAGVSVEGNSASWSMSHILSVGRVGEGTLSIAGGAAVSNTGNGYIGETAGTAVGAVTVDGSGSGWNTGERLLVGVLGTGSLDISNSAEVSNATEAVIGDQASGNGMVNVNDATWTSGDLMYVGNYGTGRLNITNGGSVSNTYGTAGFHIDSYGEISVADAGSTWTSSEEINIGNSGKGSLSIVDGGQVIGQSNSRIGSYMGSAGEAAVSGTGSLWLNSGTLFVGREGTGTLTLGNEGEVAVGAGSGTVILANGAGSTGTLNIGAPEGEAPAVAGTLSAGALSFGEGNGTLVFNHTGTDDTFDVDISGDGTILHKAGLTTYTGDGAAFTGNAIISGGSSFNMVNKFGGEVVVKENAILVSDPFAGQRTEIDVSGLGDLIKSGEGTLNLLTDGFSGNISILGGDLHFQPGSILILDRSPTITVGGCANLTGTLTLGDMRDADLAELEISAQDPACSAGLPSNVKPPPPSSTCTSLSGTIRLGAVFGARDSCVKPGNSIGTLAVATLWVLGSDATYEVELKGGGTTPGEHNDLMQVDAAAVLEDGALIHVLPEDSIDDGPAGYEDGSVYTIVQANELIVEGDIIVTDDYDYLDFTVSSDGQNLYLTSHATGDEPGEGDGPGAGDGSADVRSVPTLSLPLLWLTCLGLLVLARRAKLRS